MQQKQFKEGRLQRYNATSRNKKNIDRQPNFTPKTTGKKNKKPRKIRRKEIIKIQAEIIKKK